MERANGHMFIYRGFKVRKILLVLLMAFTALGCGGGKRREGSKNYRVAYICNNFNDTFQTYVMDAAKKYFSEVNNVDLIAQDALEDVVRQQDLVNTMIAQGIDALIVVPVDTSAMTPITRAAAEAKVPLVFVNRNPYAGKPLPEKVYYVGSQEIIAGKLQMGYIGSLLKGVGGISILMGKLDNEGALKRTEGVERYALESFPAIRILAKETGNWQRDQAMVITENWITAYGPNLNAILSNNDEMALGAIEALRAAGREDVYVVGIDAIPDALEAILAGTLAGTVLQDSKGQGMGAARIAHQALEGRVQSSLVWVPFVLITPENIAEFL